MIPYQKCCIIKQNSKVATISLSFRGTLSDSAVIGKYYCSEINGVIIPCCTYTEKGGWNNNVLYFLSGDIQLLNFDSTIINIAASASVLLNQN